jgi:hypothetical protein
MGFKIGKQLIYVPVFFLNGKLKGTDVMYLKNSDIFVTNTEQWVNYIIGQEQGNMGSASDNDDKSPDSGEVSKSLSLFSRPPSSASKTASIEDYSTVSVEDFIDKDVLSKPSKMNLVDFIKKAGRENYKKIAEIISDSRIWKCVTKFYSPEDLKIHFESQKVASGQKEEGSEGVKIIKLHDSIDGKIASELSSSEKIKLFETGYIIKNAASGDSATKMYLDDKQERFHDVTESGLYNILNESGQLVEAYVFIAPLPIDAIGSSSGGSGKLIVSKKNKIYRHTYSSVYCITSPQEKSVNDKTDKESLFSEGGSINSVTIGKVYLLVCDDMTAYGPFEVEDKIRDNGKVTIVARQDYSCGCYCGHYDQVKIRSIDLNVRRIDRAGDTIYVPKCFKFLEVRPYKYSDKNLIDIRPGTFSTVIDALSAKGGLKAIFEKRDREIKSVIEDKSASFNNRGDFVFYLCDTMKLPLVSAEKIASALDGNRAEVRAVFMPKVAFPQLPNPSTSVGTTKGGIPEEMQASESQRATDPVYQQPATDQEFGKWDQPSKEELDLLERASNSDSREVFDPAMIGIIVRTSRAQSMVQEYIPEFVDNLDRMIRLLLLFYWHNAEFAEAYGIDQMADFEDLLSSTIKNTSKTILFLKQKSIESSSGGTDIF